MNKFSCAKEIYKIVIIRWRNAGYTFACSFGSHWDFARASSKREGSESYRLLELCHITFGVAVAESPCLQSRKKRFFRIFEKSNSDRF